MDINLILNTIFPLPQASANMLVQNISEVQLPKGTIILHAGKIENSLYFIKKGIVRAYSDTENNQITFWFGKEGDTIISMRSYVAGQISYENIELLEDCELYKIDSSAINALYNTDIDIANWGRKFAEYELLKTEERLISKQFKTASERYKELTTNYPHLLQRVQLGHIASYLGITQASLSRIRAVNK